MLAIFCCSYALLNDNTEHRLELLLDGKILKMTVDGAAPRSLYITITNYQNRLAFYIVPHFYFKYMFIGLYCILTNA
jgi:hypothetical protein